MPRPEWWWRTASRGSARLMRPSADTLALRGFVVMLFDFAGHGRNTVQLRWGRGRCGRAAFAFGVRCASVPGSHSSAGPETRYAASHSDIAATSTISLGSLG